MSERSTEGTVSPGLDHALMVRIFDAVEALRLDVAELKSKADRSSDAKSLAIRNQEAIQRLEIRMESKAEKVDLDEVRKDQWGLGTKIAVIGVGIAASGGLGAAIVKALIGGAG